jgi:hypothetical protein
MKMDTISVDLILKPSIKKRSFKSIASISNLEVIQKKDSKNIWDNKANLKRVSKKMT